jgi:hypothetical protein
MKSFGIKFFQLNFFLLYFKIDINEIKLEYKRLYGKSLFEEIQSETSGDFRKLLLSLLDK